MGGRPLPVTIVRDATNAGGAVDSLIGELRAERFVRSGFRDGHEVIEPTHDRIRETIVASLSPAALRERHRQLARALEAMPGADLEALSAHLLGAGDKERAADYAERAADQAVSKLAFDQAVRLFRVTLRIIGPEASEMRRLSTRLASVLEWSGRGGEAALVYLDAARGAPAGERVELERAAAEQLLACGRIDEGALVLRGVLASMGIHAPRTALGALVSLLVHRVWLLLIGLRFQDRSPDEVSREDRIRVDALYSIGLGLSMVDVILGASMQSRHLLLALRVGDRSQVVRATSLEAAQLASVGGAVGRRELAVLEIAGRLVERGSDTEGDTFLRGSHAVGMFLRGRWREAHRALDTSYLKYPNHRAGWHANAKLFSVYALYYIGDLLRADATRDAAPRRGRAAQRSLHRGEPADDVDGGHRAGGRRPGGRPESHPRGDGPVVAERLSRPALEGDGLGRRGGALRGRRRPRLRDPRPGPARAPPELPDARAVSPRDDGVRPGPGPRRVPRGRARRSGARASPRPDGSGDGSIEKRMPWTSALSRLVAAAVENASGRPVAAAAFARGRGSPGQRRGHGHSRVGGPSPAGALARRSRRRPARSRRRRGHERAGHPRPGALRGDAAPRALGARGAGE